MDKKPIVTIVSAVYNEAASIEEIISESYNEISKRVPCHILIAEDGSTDGTREILLRLKKKYPMTLILGKQKKGFQRAVIDALSSVKTPLAFFIDADLQWDPKDFWKLYKKIDDNDLVVGKKIIRRDLAFRKFLGWGFSKIVSLMFNLPISDADSGYKLIKREVLRDVLPEIKTLKYGFQTELTIRAFHKGYDVEEAYVNHRFRKDGTTRTFPLWRIPYVVSRTLINLIQLRNEIYNKKK